MVGEALGGVDVSFLKTYVRTHTHTRTRTRAHTRIWSYNEYVIYITTLDFVYDYFTLTSMCVSEFLRACLPVPSVSVCVSRFICRLCVLILFFS